VNRAKLYIALLFTTLLCVQSKLHAQSAPLRFPESRSVSPGKLWLGWSSGERTGFVRGFLIGYDDGYRRACLTEAVKSQPSAAEDLDPCLKEQHLFHKDLTYYVKFVTDYYMRYSGDWDVPIRELLMQADQKTPDEVHQSLATKSSD
jgi:hypothetical protein